MVTLVHRSSTSTGNCRVGIVANMLPIGQGVLSGLACQCNSRTCAACQPEWKEALIASTIRRKCFVRTLNSEHPLTLPVAAINLPVNTGPGLGFPLGKLHGPFDGPEARLGCPQAPRLLRVGCSQPKAHPALAGDGPPKSLSRVLATYYLTWPQAAAAGRLAIEASG